MISKIHPRYRKLIIAVGLLVLWFLLLLSPIGQIVAVLTIVVWIFIFLVLGFVRVRRPPQ